MNVTLQNIGHTALIMYRNIDLTLVDIFAKTQPSDLLYMLLPYMFQNKHVCQIAHIHNMFDGHIWECTCIYVPHMKSYHDKTNVAMKFPNCLCGY